MWTKINKYFYYLTKRNWGAPWHFIIACLATSLFLALTDIESIWNWYFCLYSMVLLFIAAGYETWQLNQGEETREGAAEDIFWSILGYITAILPILDTSYSDLVHLAAAPLIISKFKKPYVCLDPGHGGKFPGAIAGGVQESLVNIRYGHRLMNILLDYNIDVALTRYANELAPKLNTDLAKRVEFANEKDFDLFISIHCNAAENKKASGFEIWTCEGQTKSDEVAEYLYKAVSGAFPDLKIRKDFSDGDSDKEKDFVVLKKTKMPAVLLELGFLSNDVEREKLLSYIYTEKMCFVIAQGIQNVFKT